MRKPLKLSQVAAVVKSAREAGMGVVSFLLIGLPGESEQNMKRTAEFALEIGFDWNVLSMVLPLPGTQIYKDLTNLGHVFDYTDYARYTIPIEGVSEIPSERLITLKEEFNNRLNFEQNYNLTHGNVNVAISRFEELLSRYPNLEKIHYHLALAQYMKGEINYALKSFEKSSELNPTYKNTAAWVEALKNLTATNERGDLKSLLLPTSVEKSLNFSYQRNAIC